MVTPSASYQRRVIHANVTSTAEDMPDNTAVTRWNQPRASGRGPRSNAKYVRAMVPMQFHLCFLYIRGRAFAI